eukprot:8219811-Pyramimonas_sp.AAC.1
MHDVIDRRAGVPGGLVGVPRLCPPAPRPRRPSAAGRVLPPLLSAAARPHVCAAGARDATRAARVPLPAGTYQNNSKKSNASVVKRLKGLTDRRLR